MYRSSIYITWCVRSNLFRPSNNIFSFSFQFINTKQVIFHSHDRVIWFFIFIGGVGYGYLLYTPYLEKWFYSPVYMAVDSSSYDVAQIPFPAITICSNNKIVERQLESVLLTQPWRGLTKRDPKFPIHFKKALTAIVMARENPPMLDNLDGGTVSVLNKYQDSLPEVLKRVSLVLIGKYIEAIMICYKKCRIQ